MGKQVLDPKQKLYEGMVEKGLYTKTFNDFENQFSNDISVGKLYEGLKERGLYTKSLPEFHNQFGFVKKKEESGVPYTQPSQESEVSSAPQPQEEVNTPSPEASGEAIPQPPEKTDTLRENLYNLPNEGKIAGFFYDVGKKVTSMIRHTLPAMYHESKAADKYDTEQDFQNHLQVHGDPKRLVKYKQLPNGEAEVTLDKSNPEFESEYDKFKNSTTEQRVEHLKKAQELHQKSSEFLVGVPKNWQEAKTSENGITSYIANAIGQGLTQMPLGMATFGASSFYMERGDAYHEAVDAIAKESKKTPEEVIKSGEDAPAKKIADVVGLVNGTLDAASLGGILSTFKGAAKETLKNVAKKQLQQSVLKEVAKKGAKITATTTAEAATEWQQEMNTQLGALYAANGKGKSPEEFFKDVNLKDVSEGGDIDYGRNNEAALQAIIATGPVSTIGVASNNLLNTKQQDHALQKSSASGLLQHPQEGVGKAGSERGRVEPSIQRNAPSKEGGIKQPEGEVQVPQEEKVIPKEEFKPTPQEKPPEKVFTNEDYKKSAPEKLGEPNPIVTEIKKEIPKDSPVEFFMKKKPQEGKWNGEVIIDAKGNKIDPETILNEKEGYIKQKKETISTVETGDKSTVVRSENDVDIYSQANVKEAEKISDEFGNIGLEYATKPIEDLIEKSKEPLLRPDFEKTSEPKATKLLKDRIDRLEKIKSEGHKTLFDWANEKNKSKQYERATNIPEVAPKETQEDKIEPKTGFNSKMEEINSLNEQLQNLRKENPKQFNKNGSLKANSKLESAYRGIISKIEEQKKGIQSSMEEEFSKRAKESNEISRQETEKINQEFQARQDELNKYLPEEERKENEVFDKVNFLIDNASEKTLSDEEVNYLNENAFKPKGYIFDNTGSLIKPKSQENVQLPEKTEAGIGSTVREGIGENTAERGTEQAISGRNNGESGNESTRQSEISQPSKEGTGESSQPSVGKKISFEWLGDTKEGEVVSENADYVKVKSGDRIYPIRKSAIVQTETTTEIPIKPSPKTTFNETTNVKEDDNVRFDWKHSVKQGTVVSREGSKVKIKSGKKTYVVDRSKILQESPETSDDIVAYNRRKRNPIGIVANGLSPNFMFDTDLGDKVKKFFKEQFTSKGYLPQSVFDRWNKTRAEISAYESQIRFSVGDLKRAIQKEYAGKITDAQITDLNSALSGKQPKNPIPAKTLEVVQDMRAQIDNLSQRFIDEGIVAGDLSGKFTENLGTYLTRSYRKYDDPFWAEFVPEEVKNKAMAFLRQKYTNYSQEEMQGLINYLLYSPEAPMAILKGSKLGSKDLSILKKRGEIAPEIRALMGEYGDPMLNYARSVTKMANLVAKNHFLQDIKQEGMNKFLFEKPQGQYFAPIAAEGSRTMAPLNGLYTTPEIAQAFAEFNANESNSKFIQYLLKFFGYIKAGKTIFSIQTHARNFFGNLGFVIANGHWRLNKFGKAAQVAFANLYSSDKAIREKLQEYIKLGIVQDSASAGELRKIVGDIRNGSDFFERINEGRLNKVKNGVLSTSQNLYQFEDDIYKIFAFENEYERYKKAYPAWTEDQLKEKSAEIVRSTYPTYSLVPKIVKALRFNPFIGSFVAFPAEVIRTAYNTAALAKSELMAKETADIGAQRLAGLMIAISLPVASSIASRAFLGMDDDDDKALRKFVAPWQETSEFLYLGHQGDKVTLLDMGYSDPFSYLKRPFYAFMNGDNVPESAFDMSWQILQPFLSEEMVLTAYEDVIRNQKKTGGQVYNPYATPGEIANDIYKHVEGIAQVGTIKSIQNLSKALKGTTDQYGRQYDFGKELTALFTGQKTEVKDISQAYRYRLYRLSDAIKQTKKEFNLVMRNPSSTEEAKKQALKRKVETFKNIFQDYRNLKLSALQLGVNLDQTKGEVEKEMDGLMESVKNE